MAKVFEYSFLGAQLLVLALALLFAIQVSLWLGLLALLLLNLGLIAFIYNFDAWLVRRLTKSDPWLMLSLCESGFVGRIRRVVGKIPAGPRCRFCQVPFGGLGKLLHIRPEPKNPNFCRSCFEGLPVGTNNTEAGVLFADVRGFTAYSEKHTAVEAREKLSRFYSIAERVLTDGEAIVEYVGDEVMAIFLPAMPPLKDRVAEAMLATAKNLVSAIREDQDALPIGVGINVGNCEVGNVRKGGSKDFTAVGDVVNTAARLQSVAKEFEIVLSERVHAAVGDKAANARAIDLALKGKEKPTTAYVIAASDIR